MKIIVLVKQVPNTTDVKVDPKTGNLIREGIEAVINPEDRHGIELAVRLKEKYGGRVVAVSMGPPQAVDVLTEALGLGADEGLLLTDRLFAGADTWATAFTLGQALETLRPFDLIIAGRQATDGDTAQIGPQVAEGLGLPQATYVRTLTVEEDRIIAERMVEDGIEVVRMPMPALVTVIETADRPRYPRIPGLLAACRDQAPIKTLDAADLGARADLIGLSGSFTRVVKTFSPKVQREGRALEGTPEEMAGALARELQGLNLIGGRSWP